MKEGAADRVVERFANSRGNVQGFPGFVSMEVLRSEEADEVLVVTLWESKHAFDAWVGSAELCPPPALLAPRLTLSGESIRKVAVDHSFFYITMSQRDRG